MSQLQHVFAAKIWTSLALAAFASDGKCYYTSLISFVTAHERKVELLQSGSKDPPVPKGATLPLDTSCACGIPDTPVCGCCARGCHLTAYAAGDLTDSGSPRKWLKAIATKSADKHGAAGANASSPPLESSPGSSGQKGQMMIACPKEWMYKPKDASKPPQRQCKGSSRTRHRSRLYAKCKRWRQVSAW